MKKRILAFALTLAMVVTSLSMLSFVSFADDVVAQSESTAKDFYAYRGTLSVDSRLGVDELWVPINKEIAPSVSLGMSWDYENVYLAIYNEAATNGVAGTRADYIDSFEFNIGGATASGSLTTNTYVVSGDGKVALGYTGATGYRCVIEASFPLSEIELDTEALAAGKLVVPTTFTINQIYADASEVNTTAEYNVILSGRSVIAHVDHINPTGANANGKELFTGHHAINRSNNAASVAGTEGFTSITGRGAGFSAWTVRDETTLDGMIESANTTVDLHEYVSVLQGGKSYYEFEFTIDNLPANGDVTALDSAGVYTSSASNIFVAANGMGNSSGGAIAQIWDAGENGGLSISYTTASGLKTVSLGVDEGETFWLGFNEISSSKIEIYVNDELLADDMISKTLGATSDNGYMWLAYHRGKSGVGEKGYSLDLDENGVVEGEEVVSFKMNDSVLTNVADVDVNTVASLTKTGGKASTTTIIAGRTNDMSINVGSLSKAYATFSTLTKTISVTVETANIDSVTVKVGGFEATATINVSDASTRPDTMGATLDSESQTAGATVSVADIMASRITITVPMSKVAGTKDSTGNVTVALSVYVEKSDKATDKADRINCIAEAFVNGNIILAPYAETLIDSIAPGFSKNDTGMISAGSGTFTYESTDAATSGVSNAGSHLSRMDVRREIAFDLTVTSLTAYDSKDIPALNMGATADGYNFNRLHFYFIDNANTACKGQVMFAIYNTSDKGLVLSYFNATEDAGSVIPLNANVEDTLSIVIRFDPDNAGFISVNGTKVVEKADIRSLKNGNSITGGSSSGLFHYAIHGDSANSFSYTATNVVYKRYNPGATKDATVSALGECRNALPSNGAIGLSYVQESVLGQTKTGAALTHGTAAGQGGTLSNDNSTMSVANTYARAYAQGGMNVLSVYANRTIEFTLNVDNLNAYDFSNDGAYTGDDKYTTNINAAHGANAGIGGDLTEHAYDKLLIGAVSKNSTKSNELAAMALYVVNDTTDGLVIIHTDYYGNETVIYVGDKIGDDISVSIKWYSSNDGYIKVDGAKTALSECRTVISTYTADNGGSVQCYFANCNGSANGYFGLNAVTCANSNRDEDINGNGTLENSEKNLINDGYAIPRASLTLNNVTTGGSINTRFIATINTLDAKVAGFEINRKGSEKIVTATTTTAYKAIATNYDLDMIVAPDGSYFIAVTINDVPATGTVTFVVRPFYTYGAETIYGAAYEVTYTNGAFVSAVAAE